MNADLSNNVPRALVRFFRARRHRSVCHIEYDLGGTAAII